MKFSIFTRCWLPVTVTAVSLLGGCDDGRPERVPVSGQVLIDGEPLSAGFVRFIPAGNRNAQAVLDEQGRFRLETFGEGDGAVPGRHKIEVHGFEPVTATSRRWLAPRRYANYQTSDLAATIEKPTDDLVIELTWDGDRPFIEYASGATSESADGQAEQPLNEGL